MKGNGKGGKAKATGFREACGDNKMGKRGGMAKDDVKPGRGKAGRSKRM